MSLRSHRPTRLLAATTAVALALAGSALSPPAAGAATLFTPAT
jgi:hypothetical protein